MQDMQDIVQSGPKWWKAVRLIRIDALPPLLPPEISAEVLMRCQHEHVSVELCVSTAASSLAELSILLLLRASSAIPDETLNRLERASSMVKRLLHAANIHARSVDGDDQENIWIESFFGREQKATIVGCGFFPAESVEYVHHAFIPGCYTAEHTEQIDIGRLASILAKYPNSLLSVQLNQTQLMPGERQLISKNYQWFTAQKSNLTMLAGAHAFYELEKVGLSPLFLINFYCMGSETFVRDMSAMMSLCQYQAYRFPFGAAIHGQKYQTYGDQWITALALRYGHSPNGPRNLSPQLRRLTHLTTLHGAVKAFSLPRYAENIPGIRINRVSVSAEPLPVDLTRPNGIYIGQQEGTRQPVFLKPDQLIRHGFFVGKPGSGKTTFALGLLYRLQTGKTKIPFLVIEPAKQEYRSLLDVLPNLRIYTPGNSNVAPIQLNPFLPPPGVTLEQYKPNLEAIFHFAVSMTHPLDIIFPQVISRCYSRHGWMPDSMCSSAGVHIFGIHEFIREFRAYAQETYGSDPESMHNIENGGIMRLMALINNPLFDTTRSTNIEELLSIPTVVELDAIGNASQKALVMGILLIQIMLCIQQRKDSGSRLKNLILLDEAHLLLSTPDRTQPDSPDAPSSLVQLLQNMTVILRAYGTGLMFGDQSPSRLTNVILSNVNLKMMFRLDSQTDRAMLADVALLKSDMVTGMVSLPAGKAYMLCDQMSVPAYITTPNVEEELKLNKSISDQKVRDFMQIELEPPFAQCVHSLCGNRCNSQMRKSAQLVADNLMGDQRIQSGLSTEGSQGSIVRFLQKDFVHAAQTVMHHFSVVAEKLDDFIACVKIQLIRALLLSPQCRLQESALFSCQEGDNVVIKLETADASKRTGPLGDW